MSDGHSSDDVIFEQSGHSGRITLNRPKALNALTHGMALDIGPKLEDWDANPKINHVVIGAAGDKAFCAGGDVRRLYELGTARDRRFLAFYHDEYILNTAIKRYSKPYIALIDGIVMGGGVGVSFHGSHRVMTENATFAMPETGIGLFPDVGGTYFLPRCPGEIGMYLALTGTRLKAADAHYAGLATHFVPRGDLALLQKALNERDVDDAIADFDKMPEGGKLADLQDWIDEAFSGSGVEDIIDRLRDLEGESGEWAKKTIDTIQTKSPTSLKITYRQIREGAKVDFEECMRIEYRMVNRIFSGHDFFEGTRAIIIDKDNAPDWQPKDLTSVSDELVDTYFADLGEDELELQSATAFREKIWKGM